MVITNNVKKTPNKFSITDPLIGSDPEVFVYSEEENRIVSAIGKIGGSKWMPRPIKDAPGFFVQEDNVLGEYNIPPAPNKAAFVANIHNGLELLQNQLPENHRALIQTSHRFEPAQLDGFYEAFQLGCDPDFNAWTGKRNSAPKLASDKYLRSSGGHVSIGYKNPNKKANLQLVKMADSLLGVPSVILDPDKERRRLYGKAGAFRHKDYGVEYRTLSSFWLASKGLTAWVYDQLMEVIKSVNESNYKYIEFPDSVQEIINTGDVEMAKIFVEDYGIKMP